MFARNVINLGTRVFKNSGGKIDCTKEVKRGQERI